MGFFFGNTVSQHHRSGPYIWPPLLTPSFFPLYRMGFFISYLPPIKTLISGADIYLADSEEEY